jgi:hypothetical protein
MAVSLHVALGLGFTLLGVSFCPSSGHDLDYQGPRRRRALAILTGECYISGSLKGRFFVAPGGRSSHAPRQVFRSKSKEAEKLIWNHG